MREKLGILSELTLADLGRTAWTGIANKVATVKESYFTKNTTTNSGEVIEEDEDAPAVQAEGSMAQYLSAIKKTTK